MRITVPEVFVDDTNLKQKSKKDVPKSFEQEIKELLIPPKLTSKYIVNQQEQNTSQFNLQVLLKFIQLCREETIPRHIKAFQIIQAKHDIIQCQLNIHQRHLIDLKQQKLELEESTKQLQAKRQLVLSNHQALKERLTETFQKLQDYCKGRTHAEMKMLYDLKNLENKVEELNVGHLGAKKKWEYYNEQVNAQTRMVEKYSKPGYLDRNRAVFLRKSLNVMLKDIEELVHRTKHLKEKTSELIEFECPTSPPYV